MSNTIYLIAMYLSMLEKRSVEKCMYVVIELFDNYFIILIIYIFQGGDS